MFWKLISLMLLSSLILLGCADTKDPAGPDTGVPIFEVVVDHPVIAPLENTMISLQPVLTLDFEQLDGMLVWFSGTPDSGIFNDGPFRYVDISKIDNLNLPIWYQYVGFGGPDTIEVKLYAHVVSQTNDTLAWNYAEISIVGTQ